MALAALEYEIARVREALAKKQPTKIGGKACDLMLTHADAARRKRSFTSDTRRMSHPVKNVGVIAIVVGCLSLVATVPAHGQNRQFDVASVKPTAISAGRSIVLFPLGGIKARNVSLSSLIKIAWQLQDDQLDGDASWIRSERFDVEASLEGNPSRDELRLMLRSLLTKRFKLAVRTEVRELPIFELRVARHDRRLGPSLQPSPFGGCTPIDLSAHLPRRTTSPVPCGVLYSRTGRWRGRAVPMHALVTPLSHLVGRVVLDRTNLSGVFDLDLHWTNIGARHRAGGPAPLADGPSSFVGALEDELGLTLQPAKAPVDVLVIERAEHPSLD